IETPLFVNGQFVPPAGSPLDAFPKVPPVSSLPQSRQTRWHVDPLLHTPTFFFQALQLERQLPRHTTLTTGAYYLHITHVILARHILINHCPEQSRPRIRTGSGLLATWVRSINTNRLPRSIRSRFSSS